MKVVYIDTQNVHKAIEELGWIIDWELLYAYLMEKFSPDKIRMFWGYIKRFEHFYKKLQDIWYELVFKQTSHRADGSIKWNVDVDLTISAMDDLHINSLSLAYLISGDSDYNTLITRLDSEWKFGRLIVPNLNKTSSHLRAASGNKIQALTELKHKIKKEAPTEVEATLWGWKQSPHSPGEHK